MVEFEEKKNINLKEDIKCSQMLENIFSFLEKKKKLDLIIYNKEIRKKFGVNIQDYKISSGKYKKGGKNGFGREYTLNKNNLIFEGEYLNGKRNGKGKEYYFNGNLKFEGEYLKGKKWNGKGYNINNILDLKIEDGNGKGKDYNYYGYLEYKGEYSNGEKNGKGKEYYDGKFKCSEEFTVGWEKLVKFPTDSELLFEGEFLRGERNGKGKEYYKDGKLKFEGEYLNGKRNGKVKEYFNNGNLKFEGKYINGRKWNGNGYNKDGIIDFEIKDGSGKGKEYYDNDELKFEGEYLCGDKNGKGKEYYLL